MAVHILLSELVNISAYEAASISFSIPNGSGQTWCYASLAVSGSVTGSAEQYVLRAYSGADEQIRRVSYGERVGDSAPPGVITQVMDGWNGLDDAPHPIYGQRGQIWLDILALQPGGGTLTLSAYLCPAHRTGTTGDGEYYIWEPGPEGGSASVRFILSIFYGSGPAPPTPGLMRVQVRHSTSTHPSLPIGVSASLCRYVDRYTSQGQWVVIHARGLDTLSLLSRHNVALNEPHPESGVGCVILPSGQVVLSFEDHDWQRRYLAHPNLAITSSSPATGTMVVDGATLYINHHSHEWTELPDLGWPAAGVIASVVTPAGVVALSATVSASSVILYTSQLDATGYCKLTTVIASGLTGGADTLWSDHYLRESPHGGLAGVAWCPPDVIVVWRQSSDLAYLARCSPDGVPRSVRVIGTMSGQHGAGHVCALAPRQTLLLSGGAWVSHDRGQTWLSTNASGNGAAFSWRHRLIWSQRAQWATQWSGVTWIVDQITSYAYTDDYGKSWNSGSWL